MKLLLSLLFSLFLISVHAQAIYSKAYGNQKNPAVIFIHGGPSGNATLFEGTTAQKLADKGFYVIVYDRRGEGRSKDENATMTFKESFEDLKQLYNTYHIKKQIFWPIVSEGSSVLYLLTNFRKRCSLLPLQALYLPNRKPIIIF